MGDRKQEMGAASGKFASLVVLLILMTACSSRVVYEPSNIVAGSADAININTASVDELEKLPYIRTKTAESIIEFRTQNGAFRRVEHLMQIRGVSEKRYSEIRHLIKTE